MLCQDKCSFGIVRNRVLCISTEVPQQGDSKAQQTLQPAEMSVNPSPQVEATDRYSTHKDTKALRQTGTHTLWRRSACSGQSCCLQVDGSARADSSGVVLNCYCPEAVSSSINDAQLSVRQIPLLSSPACTLDHARTHTHTHAHTHTRAHKHTRAHTHTHLLKYF